MKVFLNFYFVKTTKPWAESYNKLDGRKVKSKKNPQLTWIFLIGSFNRGIKHLTVYCLENI